MYRFKNNAASIHIFKYYECSYVHFYKSYTSKNTKMINKKIISGNFEKLFKMI